MIETLSHLLTNCHGEFQILVLGLGSVPFLGPWILSRVRSRHEHAEDDRSGDPG